MMERASKQIWITVEDTSTVTTGAREGGRDTGGVLNGSTSVELATRRRVPISSDRLKQELTDFLQVTEEVFAEATQRSSGMRLDEVEVEVEVNAEGQVSLFGTGGRVGGKGAIRLKFKLQN
jgi:hypothetical protein